MAVAAHNLGRLMRLLSGTGKPKSLQGDGGLAALAPLLIARLRVVGARVSNLTTTLIQSFARLDLIHNAPLAA